MAAPYPTLNATNFGSDITQMFTYTNEVTGGFMMPFILIAFFLTIFISSMVLQQRFTARIRPETSFLAASFASLGFAVILAQKTGLLDPIWTGLAIGLTILGFIWVVMSSD